VPTDVARLGHPYDPTMPTHPDRRSRSWALIAQLAERLAADEELAAEFERTPGKVAQQVGVPRDSVPDVLAALSRPIDPAASDARAPDGREGPIDPRGGVDPG
jgi:hypothetical protein